MGKWIVDITPEVTHLFGIDDKWLVENNCVKIEPLAVVATIYQNDEDAENVPLNCWSDTNAVPMYFIGAWEDELDFLPDGTAEKDDQQDCPQRMSFIFNRTPDNIEEIHAAIIKELT